MPLDGERQIGGTHAAAVVGDADQREPAGRRHHLDVGGAGIERVLDQLLHHAGRPLDHLAGGDAVDGLRSQLADRHGMPPMGRAYALGSAATRSRVMFLASSTAG